MKFDPNTWRPTGWQSGATPLDSVIRAAAEARARKKRREPLTLADFAAMSDAKLLADCYATPRWVWRLAGLLCGVAPGEWSGDPFHNPWARGADEYLAPDAWRFDGSTPDLDGLRTLADDARPGWHKGPRRWSEDECLRHDPDAERIEAAWFRLFGEELPDDAQALAKYDGGDSFATLFPGGRVAWSTYEGSAISLVPDLQPDQAPSDPAWPGTGPLLVNGRHSDNGAWLPLCAAAGRTRIVVAVVPSDAVGWYIEHGMQCDFEVQLGRLDYDPPPGLSITGNERCSSLLIWHPEDRDKPIAPAMVHIRDDKGKVRRCPVRPALRNPPAVIDWTDP